MPYPVKTNRRIRMQETVRTKGTTIKKGELVTLKEYGRDSPVGSRATVHQKGYGLVSVPATAVADGVRKVMAKKAYPRLTGSGRLTHLRGMPIRKTYGGVHYHLFHDRMWRNKTQARMAARRFRKLGNRARVVKSATKGRYAIYIRFGRR